MNRTFVSFGTTGVVLLLSLGTSVLLARTLGPEGRGLLLALTFWPILLAAVLNLSFNEAMSYRTARNVGTDREQVVAATGLWAVLLLAALAVPVIFGLLHLVVQDEYRPYFREITLFMAIFVPLTYLHLLFMAKLQGRGQMMRVNLLRVTQPLFYLIFLLGSYGLTDFGVLPVMAAMLSAQAVSVLTGALLAGPGVGRPDRDMLRELGHSGWTFHKANLLLFASAELDKIIVLALLSTTEIGLYAVAVSMSTIGYSVVEQSLGLILMREMAAADGRDGQRQVFIRTMRTAVAVLVLVNGLAAALAVFWVPLLFGADFSDAVLPTMLLLGMGALKGTRHMIDKSLRATHHTRTGIVAEIVSFAALAILGSAGAWMAGLVGVAAAAAAAQALGLLAALLISRRHMGYAVSALWPLRMSVLHELRAQFQRPGAN